MARRLARVDNVPDSRWFSLASSHPRGFTVQGRKATRYEYNVALAFDHFRLPYIFQFAVGGGRKIKGGILLDFMVLTKPLSTPCWVHGERWHMGYQRTLDLMKQVTLYLMLRGEINQPVILWGDMVKTEEEALVSVRKFFHV